MKKVNLLIAKELFIPFLFSACFLTIFLTIAQIIGISDTLIEISMGFNEFLSICLVTLPSSWLFAIPMSTLLTVFLGIMRLSRDNEMLALLTMGISPGKPLLPVFIFSLSMTFFSFFVSFYLYPDSVKEVREIIKTLTDNILSKGLSEKVFFSPAPGLTFFITESFDEGKTFKGVFVRDNRDKRAAINIYASGGELKNDKKSAKSALNLTDGLVVRPEWNKDKADIIKFKNYTMKITKLDKPIKESRGEMNIMRLSEIRKDTTISKNKKNLYACEFHKRIAIPVGTLLLGIIAMPIAFVFGRTTITGGVGIGTIIFLLYYISMVFVTNLADSGKVDIMLAVWSPNLVLTVFAGILFWGLETNFRLFK
jgi:LPS export ABC transporter permease LptF